MSALRTTENSVTYLCWCHCLSIKLSKYCWLTNTEM